MWDWEDNDIFDEDCELEYSEGSLEGDAYLENQYYMSKALKEDNDLNVALASFQKLIDSEDSVKGDWGIKALKQIVKINLELKNYDEMMVRYKELSTHIVSGAFSSNNRRKFITSILDKISTIENASFVQDFYKITLENLKNAKKNALCFEINLKLARQYFDRGDFDKLAVVLKELRELCLTETGEDLTKGSQLLEIYAMEIQMHTVRKNNQKLRALYKQSLRIIGGITSTTSHRPLVMGIIRECGGKMYLDEQEFDDAHSDFLEAFKNYDESGSARRITCLKYLLLTHMLTKSNINPFDSPEMKALRTDREIISTTDLVSAYETNDIKKFETNLKSQFKDDLFFTKHSQVLLENIRNRVLMNVIKPYSRIHLSYLRKELNMDAVEVEEYLSRCIANEMVQGRIDQMNQTLELNRENARPSSKYSAIDKWSSRISTLIERILTTGQDFTYIDYVYNPAFRYAVHMYRTRMPPLQYAVKINNFQISIGNRIQSR